MTPIISIIIPCYNSEATLEDTLQSVLEQEFQDWEAVIINDGSPDNLEEIALNWVQKDSRFKYFKKENGGLGSARNYGIKKASGEYILPLDSDNQVDPLFAQDAMAVFKKDPKVGVVHGHAEYFGDQKGIWKVEYFNLDRMLVHNYIDACAIYRKSLWKQAGGYDENIPYQGHEDWDFWLSLASLWTKFYHLQKVTFKYYVSSKSMINSFNRDMITQNQDYIVKKHSLLFHGHYCKVVANADNQKLKFIKKLNGKKFAIDLFCKRFFGFKIFKSKLE